MNSIALDYLLTGLGIVLLVAVCVAIYAATRIWQLREKANDDLHSTYRRNPR